MKDEITFEEIINSPLVKNMELILEKQIKKGEKPNFDKALNQSIAEQTKFMQDCFSQNERGVKIKESLMNTVYIHCVVNN